MRKTSIEELQSLMNEIESFAEKGFSSENLEAGVLNWSELLYRWEEAGALAYIAYTLDTADEEAEKTYEFLLSASEKTEPLFFQMKENFFKSGPQENLNPADYGLFIRLMKSEVELYRPENTPLGIEEGRLSKEYQGIISALSLEYEGKTYTLSQAAKFLESPNRSDREAVWMKTYESLAEKKDEILSLYQKQVELRHRQALNAGFKNYRDYMHTAKNRLDYTPQDCLQFHESIEKEILPLCSEILEKRKKLMKLPSLRPYDLKNDALGRPPLKPFETEPELIEKGLKVLSLVHPEAGEVLSRMKAQGHLDLFSRNRKAPGGYNYPLLQSRSSFIFMNAAGLHRDVVTLLHEAGHAYHAALTDEEPVFAYRSPGMEVAELASMSMELLSLNFWQEYYPDAADLKKAKLDHLEDIILFFPWMAMVDAFQHEVYLNPEETAGQRLARWEALALRFGTGADWSGLEEFRKISWLRQNHIFTVPFYYIEYGIAQLGALQMWRNYLQDPKKGFEGYRSSLKLGGRKGMKEIYEAGGIAFDFSASTVRSLMQFVKEQMNMIEQG